MKMDLINYLSKTNNLNIKAWPISLTWFATGHYYECMRCQLGRHCPKHIEHTLVPGQCRHGKWPSGVKPEAVSDPVKRWKTAANKESFDTVEISNKTEIDLTVQGSHHLKKLLTEVVNNALGLFTEASKRKVDYKHWVDNAVSLALFKEIFAKHMVVKGVLISLRPFKKEPPNPQLALSTGYLRMLIIGHVKEWSIEAIEDLREMSHSQINADCDIDDWMVTVFGQELGLAPAPSTPTSRPRTMPEQPSYTTSTR